MCIYHGNSVGLNIFKLTKLESIFSCVPRPLLRNLGQLWQLLNLFIYLRVIYLFMKETLLTRLLPPPFLYPSSLLDLLSLSVSDIGIGNGVLKGNVTLGNRIECAVNALFLLPALPLAPFLTPLQID